MEDKELIDFNSLDIKVYDKKDIMNLVKVIDSMENIYRYIGGITAFDKIDSNISNNILVVGSNAVLLKDIVGIYIFASSVATNYNLFDIMIFTKSNDNFQISIPFEGINKLNKWIS